jgi:hypothetical protein
VLAYWLPLAESPPLPLPVLPVARCRLVQPAVVVVPPAMVGTLTVSVLAVRVVDEA